MGLSPKIRPNYVEFHNGAPSDLPYSVFLIYINGLPKSSEKLSFKIIADDTNVFASARDFKTLEHMMNSELAKVKRWCDISMQRK